MSDISGRLKPLIHRGTGVGTASIDGIFSYSLAASLTSGKMTRVTNNHEILLIVYVIGRDLGIGMVSPCFPPSFPGVRLVDLFWFATCIVYMWQSQK